MILSDNVLIAVLGSIVAVAGTVSTTVIAVINNRNRNKIQDTVKQENAVTRGAVEAALRGSHDVASSDLPLLPKRPDSRT